MSEEMRHDEPRRRARPSRLALAGAGLLALGGVAGAVVMAETRPPMSMAPATPVAIRSLPASGIVTIRGRVAEVFGNKFIVADGTGRMLVDAGREGDRHALVAAGAPVTVQGRFDRGFVHAALLVAPDGSVLALGPLAGPPRDPHDRPGHCAPPPPEADGRAPPPPPPAAAAAPLSATAPAR